MDDHIEGIIVCDDYGGVVDDERANATDYSAGGDGEQAISLNKKRGLHSESLKDLAAT